MTLTLWRRRQRPQQRQQSPLAGGRRMLATLLLVEDQAANAIAMLDAGPAEQRGRLRRNHRLEGNAGAETHAGTLIHQQPKRALTLVTEHLHMSPIGARRDPPIHMARIIAGHIDP
jgi:hypothetical protein